MSDNYQSPYGFGPITDMVIDNIAENAGLTPDDIVDRLEQLTEEQREDLDFRIDRDWWKDMSFARDRLSDLLSEFVNLEAAS